VVCQDSGAPAVLYVDLHLLHEVTSPQAFTELRSRGLTVRRPDRSFATIDHSLPTLSNGTPESRLQFADELSLRQIRKMEENCREYGISLVGIDSPEQGIIHVIGPELGLTQPGSTIVCGDSHTATHGAFGALAFGIGTSEVGHVLATQCLLQMEPKTFQIRVDGRLEKGVSAKDLILALINQIGVGGGTGFVLEYTGEAVGSMSMDERMTVCNMSIEAGARAGMIAPDETTFDYLAGRKFAPSGADWEKSLARWRGLPADENAVYDRSITLNAALLEPMITFGTNPGMAVSVTGQVPDPANVDGLEERAALERSLAYMGLTPGAVMAGHPVDVVFIGSCTNGRLSDLRQASSLIKGRRIPAGVRVLVVPGSGQVKRQAEAEGLHRIFVEAGAEWREPGCSMCIAMNGDQIEPGQFAVSTTNRNFEGRQGKGGRTFLASPLTAAAAAVTGRVTDPREFM